MSENEPSPAALAQAAAMRAFDPRLSDDDLRTIALRIDRLRELGAQLSPRRRRIPNAVGPLPDVRIPDDPA